MNARMQDALLALTFCRDGCEPVKVVISKSYTLTMITDGLVACGMIRPEERPEIEYKVARTGTRCGPEGEELLRTSRIQTGDVILVSKGGQDGREHLAEFRRIG